MQRCRCPLMQGQCAAGVEKVTTVEYNEISSEHPQLETMTPETLARTWLSNETKDYDFAVSYSSYEHDGLGRYGDPIDPWGDIWDVQRVGCLIKPQGLFYLGVPVGSDQVRWTSSNLPSESSAWTAQHQLERACTALDVRLNISEDLMFSIALRSLQ